MYTIESKIESITYKETEPKGVNTHIGESARYRASRRYGRCGAALRCQTA